VGVVGSEVCFKTHWWALVGGGQASRKFAPKNNRTPFYSIALTFFPFENMITRKF
jgi:hypothetical protein